MNLYDASRDPAVTELTKQLPRREVSAEEVMKAFKNAEPEQQLCVICLLEVYSPGEPLTDLKAEAVKRLLVKCGNTADQ